MDVVTIGRKHKGIFRTYEVLREDVAAGRGITWKPWREALSGDWAISDDGYVAEVIAAIDVHPRGNGKPRRLVVLPYARVWTKQRHLSFVERHRSGNYFDTKKLSWDEEEARKTRTRNAVLLYVQMVLNGQAIDWERVGRTYRPDQELPAATVRRLFKNERIRRMIEDTLRDILKRQGITQESVVRTYVEAIDIGRSRGDAAAMIRGNDRLATLVGLDVATGRKMLPPPTDLDLETEAVRLLQEAEPVKGTSEAP